MDDFVHGDVFHISLSTIYTEFRCVILTIKFFSCWASFEPELSLLHGDFL